MQFFGYASTEVFASLNSDKENNASLSNTFHFLSKGSMVSVEIIAQCLYFQTSEEVWSVHVYNCGK